MRAIRTVFLLLLAAILVVLALANRQPATLSLKFTDYLPGPSVTLPLFLIVLLTLMAGIAIGLVWEWLREAGQRSEAASRAREIERLRREVQGLRSDHSAPADEVLAILDAPRPPPPASSNQTGSSVVPAGPSVPAKG